MKSYVNYATSVTLEKSDYMCGSNLTMRVEQSCEQGWVSPSLLVIYIFHQHVTEQLPLKMMGSAFTMRVGAFIMNYEYSLHV